jgi:SAM-dependent methyltransferase
MPDYNPVELESYVRQRAPEIARDIRAAAQKARNEADLVAEVEKLLDKFSKNFDLTLNLERERTLINGRADAVYNRFVIEYEPPNSLQKSNGFRTNKHAIEQVQNYMGGLERLDRHRKERLAGVVLDGGFYIFVRYRDDRWYIDDPLPVNPHSTETFLRYLLSLSTEKALTPENLVRDFGENSNTARQVVPVLYDVVCCTDNQKVNVLFEQWRRQFREVSGYDPASGQLDPAVVARLYAIHQREIDLEKLFFAIHTYYATFIKLLALQVAHYYLMPKVGTGLAAAADYPSDKLRGWLQDLERGGFFAQLGIRNFLEGDFFGWYLDAWDDSLHAALRRLIGDLADYSLVTLDVDPEETRDLLKQLYQNLMPKKLRHALGEYYTPDWLAERLLNQLGYDGDPAVRILDPACGSGTFPVLAIKRARRYAEEKMLPLAQVLEQILNNIVAFDLNPLAVISARTNYLLALGDLLEHRRGEISLPVYLADSILTPSQGTDLFTQHGYSFNTAVGRFTIPRSLIQAQYIDQLAGLLEECVHLQLSPEQFRQRVLGTFPLRDPEDSPDLSLLDALYRQLLDYEARGINGIWARIIKNAFAPLFQPKFDLIMGNPPWVNWESLPQDYRNDTKPLWMYHGLFPHSGMDTILGKGKKDISMLLTYVAMENYLKDGGRLGFIITQSVLKTAGAGQGFRKFRLGNSTPVCVIAVDDMADIKPFEGAANRTAIMIIDKGRPTKYPLKAYSLWYKTEGGTSIPEKFTLDEITSNKIISYRQFAAQPIDKTDLTSAWLTGRPRVFDAVSKLLGVSSFRAYEGANTGGANGVYWVELLSQRPDGLVVIGNVTEGTKRRVEEVQAAVEFDLIFPLIRERDVRRWSAGSSMYIVMVQDPSKRIGYRENYVSSNYPKLFAYLKRFEEQLRERSAFTRYFSNSDPFYSMFNIGEYTFAPLKVVWSRFDSQMSASVVTEKDNKPLIPQEAVTLVPCSSLDEAHFICAVLNSSPYNFTVQSYSMKGGKSFGTPSIIKNVRIPDFDSTDPNHLQLSSFSQQAHAAAAADDQTALPAIETEIDRLAAQLWGLTDLELKEIQESLAELG